MCRPSVHAATALALAGAGVAGYLSTGAGLSMEPTASSLSPERLQELTVSMDWTEQEDYRVEANQQATQRSQALRAAAQAAAAEAARLEAERAAATERAARDAQRESAVASTVASGISDPRGAARALVGGFGWDERQFSCVDRLWTKESNWSYTATNRSSGAYGIPQSLPGSKMGSVAADWRTNPVTQITWGLGYIRDVYGSPCSAWSHSVSRNWY